jgi:hypothetical protein
MAFHPLSQAELEIVALFRALGPEQPEFTHRLRAKVAARQAIGVEVKGEVRPAPDLPPKKPAKTPRKNRRDTVQRGQ